MTEFLQRSNETSDLQILKKQINKNNNKSMDQLLLKKLQLKNRFA